MKVIKKYFDMKSRSDEIRIVPLGDVHYGASACDESFLKERVNYIKDNENVYWIGMGDYCDFINRKDPRFNVKSIKKEFAWETDIIACQVKGFTDIVKPIANKCLGLVEGNHESSNLRHYERNVYAEIVTKIKEASETPPEEHLGLGYTGWLLLHFTKEISTDSKPPSNRIIINLHHGFVGGRLAGAKALNMQRWLWTHECDLFMMGHSHNCSVQSESVHSIDNKGNFIEIERTGVYTGTFLRSFNEDSSSYAEVKGYFPLKPKVPEIILRPHANQRQDKIKVLF